MSASTSSAFSGKTCRIMPLGASITFGTGSTHESGYRAHLYDLLTADGNTVQMVGSQSGGSFAQPRNEGYPGYFISQVHRRAVAAMPIYKPNIVTILVGTNDVGANLDAVNAPLRLTKMIQDVLDRDGQAAGVCVVVSTLPPNRDSRANARITSYNAALLDVVRDFVDAGRAVLLVDCHAVVGVEDLEDGTHPNDAAYERMARVFYDGIQEAFVKGWIFDVHASEA